VTGLVGLVPVAELLAEITGSRQGATAAALNMLATGRAPTGHDDIHMAVQHQLVVTGIASAGGEVDSSRAAELVVVCEVLGASTVTPAVAPPEPRLVLSAPAGTAAVADRERLDGLILDVIRQATTSLTIGGAFWNEAGFALLDDVLLPAVAARGIPTTVYVNTPGSEYLLGLERRLDELKAAGPVTIRWFVGPRPTMLHAKFVIRDQCQGYLGSANLTSWGMQSHVEAGVELTAGQSHRFNLFLEELDAAGLFGPNPRPTS
jgi:PLD-like domain